MTVGHCISVLGCVLHICSLPFCTRLCHAKQSNTGVMPTIRYFGCCLHTEVGFCGLAWLQACASASLGCKTSSQTSASSAGMLLLLAAVLAGVLRSNKQFAWPGVSGSSPTGQAAAGSLESSNSSWPGGLPDDMHSATTGLLTLEGDSLPNGTSPHARPLIIPEVRRPSLRAGSGSTSFAAPDVRTDHRLSRRPSFVEGGSRDNSVDAEFPALGNIEGRHAAQTYRWQQQHFGERSDSHHHHS